MSRSNGILSPVQNNFNEKSYLSSYRIKKSHNGIKFVLGTRTIFSVPFCEKISIKKSDISVKLLTIDLLKEYIWEWKNNILKDLTNNASKFDLWHVNVDEVVDFSTEEDVFRRYTSFLTGLKLKLKIKTFPHVNAFSIDHLVDALALIWHVEVESDSPGPQNDPYIELKQEPSFFQNKFAPWYN
ncbi:11359_t:CDS:2 [Funneliformis mosseae]|uniref:11359_t:CDS:1 n=1 Tax=Funneliformis mosseae TaxID=27381 RepID=A0A9N8WBM4_FUNMO|nr:11359_t:CDS:2 [Funneliformis mosseae]